MLQVITVQPKCFSNFFFGLLFLTDIFALLSADVPTTLLVFMQVVRRFHTLSTTLKNGFISTTTDGSQSLKLTSLATMPHPVPGRIRYWRQVGRLRWVSRAVASIGSCGAVFTGTAAADSFTILQLRHVKNFFNSSSSSSSKLSSECIERKMKFYVSDLRSSVSSLQSLRTLYLGNGTR